MPIIKCPSCDRPLNVGDNLAGASVRCPGCKTVFRAPAAAPAAPPPSAPPPPAPPPPAPRRTPKPKPAVRKAARAPAPAPSPSVEENPFDFGGPVSSAASSPAQALDFRESDEEAAPSLQTRRQVRSAAAWLNYLAGSEVVLAIILVIVAALIGAAQSAGVALLGLIFGSVCASVGVGVPVVFLVLGARNLQTKKSYGLAVTGGVFAALNAAGLVLFSLSGFALGPAGVAFFALALGVAGTAATAAIKTFSVLSNPEVREAFRQVRERPMK